MTLIYIFYFEFKAKQMPRETQKASYCQFILATLECTTLKIGATSPYIFGELFQDSISTTSGATASVTINEQPNVPVPEPSSFLLIAAGLVGMAFLRRKNRK